MKEKIANLKNNAIKLLSKGKVWLISLSLMLITPMTAFAADVGSSTLATGTQKLVSDITTWLMILAPTVTVLLVIYYLIRKSASDEMDSKKWNSRIIVALVSCIGAVLASVIVNLLIGYYQ